MSTTRAPPLRPAALARISLRPDKQLGDRGRRRQFRLVDEAAEAVATAMCSSLCVSTPTMTSWRWSAMLGMIVDPFTWSMGLAGRPGLRWDLLDQAPIVTARLAGDYAAGMQRSRSYYGSDHPRQRRREASQNRAAHVNRFPQFPTKSERYNITPGLIEIVEPRDIPLQLQGIGLVSAPPRGAGATTGTGSPTSRKRMSGSGPCDGTGNARSIVQRKSAGPY